MTKNFESASVGALAVGALLYLVDSGRNNEVRTITSVSGGSITNAYISLLDESFNKQEPVNSNISPLANF